MIVMVAPDGAQFLLTEEEVRNIADATKDGRHTFDGRYRFVYAALGRTCWVSPQRALTEARVRWLVGEAKVRADIIFDEKETDHEQLAEAALDDEK